MPLKNFRVHAPEPVGTPATIARSVFRDQLVDLCAGVCTYQNRRLWRAPDGQIAATDWDAWDMTVDPTRKDELYDYARAYLVALGVPVVEFIHPEGNVDEIAAEI